MGDLVKRLREPAAGELWACRAGHQNPLVQVAVVRLGVKKPQRILVRFLDDEFEGLQDWVPPARLKVPWGGVDEYLARERRWELVSQASTDASDAEELAASIVFDLLVSEDLARLGWNTTRGIIRVHDVSGLASSLDLAPAALCDPTSFEEDGDLISPWTVTAAVARRAVGLDPHKVLRYVEKEEADARREAAYGRWFPRRGREDDWVSPDVCQRVDEEHGQPIRTILRDWCGAEAVDLRAEIAALRDEASSAGKVAQEAIGLLRRHGHTRDANDLERELSELRRGVELRSGGGLVGASGVEAEMTS
jgi:hypothetical protein